MGSGSSGKSFTVCKRKKTENQKTNISSGFILACLRVSDSTKLSEFKFVTKKCYTFIIFSQYDKRRIRGFVCVFDTRHQRKCEEDNFLGKLWERNLNVIWG